MLGAAYWVSGPPEVPEQLLIRKALHPDRDDPPLELVNSRPGKEAKRMAPKRCRLRFNSQVNRRANGRERGGREGERGGREKETEEEGRERL